MQEELDEQAVRLEQAAAKAEAVEPSAHQLQEQTRRELEEQERLRVKEEKRVREELAHAEAESAAAEERESRGVIEMLKKLHDKFVDERTNLDKEEMNSKHAYDMLVQDLTAQTDQAT